MTDNRTPDMPRAYDPHAVEAPLYQMWMDKGYFKPRDNPGREPFCIIMPPPNVTGELHLGHALTATVEDTLIRWHRMLGDPTLWLPGVDHAGIATQNVVEKQLAKESVTRQDLGREEFEARVWKWVGQIRTRIVQQHMRLGVSADWSREVFTLDDGPQRAVRETFKRLFDDKLIYKGERIINWCPRCQTAISDLEVEHEETQGSLWHVRYPLLDDAGNMTGEYVTVATTRPETIVGDVAIAVNPDDGRWKKIIGRKALLPIIERHIPIIADEAVEAEFGTGAVKVTPGHDATDFDIGARHNLPIIVAMNADATMNAEAGPYNGLDRFETRKLIVADLDHLGLLEKTEPHTYSIGHCERCDTIVEPLVSKQWFIRMQPLADPAIAAVKDGRIEIIPRRFERVYMNWMENIRDWCISRQLWWGHRIPVWYCDNGHMFAATDEPTKCTECGSAKLEQDPDVLDTWFSSGLWPFSTLGWPEETDDLKKWYPTSVLETGYDILFFWVARMIMLGLYDMGDVPFRHVYLHGLIRDAQGRKMTKSRGNVVDPLELTEKYGTDALRFTLATGGTPGNDFRLFDEKLESSRNFANKLWNAARFAVSSFGDEMVSLPDIGPASARADWPLEDRWIVSRSLSVAREVNQLLGDFQINEAGRVLYDFFWSEYCDWYLEMAKVRLKDALREPQDERGISPLPILAYVLQKALRLLHPIMPFVTEAIWQHLRDHVSGLEEALIIAPYPLGDAELDPEAEDALRLATLETVPRVRDALKEAPREVKKTVTIDAAPDPSLSATERGLIFNYLTRMAPINIAISSTEEWRILDQISNPKNSDRVFVTTGRVHLDIPTKGLIDLAAEREKLTKQLTEAEAEAARLSAKLADEQFRSKAPEKVIARQEEMLAAARSRAEGLQTRLNELG